MALIPSNPFNELDAFRRGMGNFFSDFPSFMNQENNHLKVDVHETDQEVIVTADVPGIEKKEDIKLNVEKNTLAMNGTIHRTNEVNDENMHRKERYTGSFHRTVPLPHPVSDEHVKARYKNGVLEVTMQKLEKEATKNIDVNFE